MKDPKYALYSRSRYNVSDYGVEYQWRPWELLVIGIDARDISDRLQFWRELNQDAVEARGPSALRQYKLKPMKG